MKVIPVSKPSIPTHICEVTASAGSRHLVPVPRFPAPASIPPAAPVVAGGITYHHIGLVGQHDRLSTSNIGHCSHWRCKFCQLWFVICTVVCITTSADRNLMRKYVTRHETFGPNAQMTLISK